MAVDQALHRVPGDPLGPEDVDESSIAVIEARHGPGPPATARKGRVRLKPSEFASDRLAPVRPRGT